MKYYARKTISFVVSLFVITAITFGALQILPGDPALLVLGTEGDPMAVEILREKLGLDDPPLTRYFKWISGVFKGDFGESIRYSTPVSVLLKNAIPVTLSLAFFSVLLAVLIAIPLGITCAVKKGSAWDSFGLIFSQLGMAMPPFWLGILLINFFAVKLGLFPPGGFVSVTTTGVGPFLSSLFLPALALSLPRAAILARMVRASILQTLDQDYIRTARSKGLPHYLVLYKHALRNASVNIFTVAGIQLTQLLAGTIVIEQVFSLPGLGQLLLNGVLQRDLPLVQGLVVVGAGLILFSNLIFDSILGVIDPRIRLD
ncbi:MAG: ABC transporter permease [Firmicutes bacterium]|nr:ABC transporter permease [Bacillota bacterium]